MTIDPRAVAIGAVVAIGVVVPPLLVYQALYLTDVIGEKSNLALIFYAVLMAGFALGGFVAGSKRPDMPLAHGALAALAAFATVQFIIGIVVLVRGDGLSILSIAFNAMLASGLGVIGGLAANRRHVNGVSDSILVVDVGTSGLRAAVVRPDASVEHVHYREQLPSSPMAGFVEFDPDAMATAAMEVAQAALADGGPVAAVGITNQRASTIVWDRVTGTPVGPGVGWQDLRTVGTCLMLQAQGVRIAPQASATKLAFLLDLADPERTRDLCFGTVDTWIAWTLSQGALHVTDLSNAAVTGLMHADGTGWSDPVLEALNIPVACLPTIVDSAGVVGEATALPGAPPIAGLAGDQQASLLGQGCVRPGQAKITFGTGGMLDMHVGPERPPFLARGEGGTFPIVAWRRGGEITWGIEAIMLSAGTNVEWLRDDLGLIGTSAESHDVATQCETADGVVYVPALLGLGTPYWDYGARGTLLGLTRGSGRAEVVRAVLEGVAQRGADLVDAAEADSGLAIPAVRVDGGMSANPTFIQALADATQRPVEVSPVKEATTLGAAFLAGLATRTWAGDDDIAATWSPDTVVEPNRRLDRTAWREACRRAAGWVPELSALDF